MWKHISRIYRDYRRYLSIEFCQYNHTNTLVRSTPDTRVSTLHTVTNLDRSTEAQPTEEEQTHPKETSEWHLKSPRDNELHSSYTDTHLPETKLSNSVIVQFSQTESNEIKRNKTAANAFDSISIYHPFSPWSSYPFNHFQQSKEYVRRVEHRSRRRVKCSARIVGHSGHLRPRSRCIKLDGDSERRLLDATRGRPEAHQESEAHSAGHCLR